MDAVLERERLTEAEREQFDGLWRGSYRELFRFAACRLMWDEGEAGAVLSDLALHWSKPSRFRQMGDNPGLDIFERYSKQTIRFLIINRLQKRGVNCGSLVMDGFAAVTPSVLRPPPAHPAKFSPVEVNAMRAERDRLLRAKIRELKPRYRRIIIMRFFLGYTNVKTGERLGISWQAVHQQLGSAIAALCKTLLPTPKSIGK